VIKHRWKTCMTCPAFELRDGAVTGRCNARDTRLYRHEAGWTTCHSAGEPDPFPNGPLFAIVQSVEEGQTNYHRVPYYQGRRPLLWLDQSGHDLSTYVQVDADEGELRFACVDDYLAFWETRKNALKP
jgi:hypothetical protein